MIIYSPVPLEQIFEGFDQQIEAPEEVEVEGVLMQVQPINSKQARIVRLISSNPQDYMNPRYSPGSLIHYRATLADE